MQVIQAAYRDEPLLWTLGVYVAGIQVWRLDCVGASRSHSSTRCACLTFNFKLGLNSFYLDAKTLLLGFYRHAPVSTRSLTAVVART